MRIPTLLVLLATSYFASTARSQTQSRDILAPATKEQTVAFVKSAFEYYRNATKNKVHFGADTRRFTDGSPSLVQLGDETSAAMLRIMELERLGKPENADAYLTLVRISFSDRSRVTKPANLGSSVTFFVLGYLEKIEIAEPALTKRIAYLRTCIGDFKCSARAEYEYLQSK
jgi:hypothetical protein